MPLVSVIIPNFNHASFLKQRIESVLNQTTQDFEVIILDDCSTDNSREIIEEYRTHPKVMHIVFNNVNSGSTFRQWEKGINFARGDYLWIAESDDFSCEMFLEKSVEKFEVDKNIVLSYCRTINIYDENSSKPIINTWGEKIKPEIWNKDFTMEGKEFIKNFLRYRNVIPNASAVVFRRDIIKNIIINTTLKFTGDWFLWVEIADKGAIAYISTPMNYFRYHSQTTRVFKTFEKEKIRMEEYLMVIEKASTLISLRFQPLNENYNWILDEWVLKYPRFKTIKALFPPYPLLLLLRFYKRLFLKIK